MKFPRPQMARSASAYGLAIGESRFSTKSAACEKSWRTLKYKAPLIQLVPISCSLARNVPLQSFAVLPILCGPV